MEDNWTTFTAEVEDDRLISITIRELREDEIWSKYVGLGAPEPVVRKLVEEVEILKEHLGEKRALEQLDLYIAAMEVCHRIEI